MAKNLINLSKNSSNPYIRIIEQPARSVVRFRYEYEGRSAGPIPGVSSSLTCATYLTIQVFNYSGVRAMVMVSCVTVSSPYRQHPHHLVGRVGFHNGICTMIIDNNDHICTFTHLGIQCAKRNEIYSKLKQRKQMQIDPTNADPKKLT
jgi:Rel/ankyrin family protein